VPIVYKASDVQSIKIFFTDASTEETKDLILDENTSKMIFERTGTIDKIEVSVKK
jgi:hypothetical protein